MAIIIMTAIAIIISASFVQAITAIVVAVHVGGVGVVIIL